MGRDLWATRPARRRTVRVTSTYADRAAVEERKLSEVSSSGEARGPVATLRRIAFLMERQREESRRIEAFRNAARTILPLPEDEVRRRAAAGTLTELAGIGPSTAAVITDACNGVVPERLVALEKTAGPLATGGEELRARLRGDLHSHSDWSDGGSPLEEMAMTAMELGHDYLVLTDHSPRLRVANGLSAERLARQLGVVDAVNEHLGGTFTLLKGIEVDILDDGSLDQTPEMLGRLDVRVASVHSKLKMDAARDDAPDDRRGPQPAHQRARPLHGPAGDRQPRRPRAEPVRRAGPSSPRARRRGSRSRSTRGPSGATRRRSCWSWRATSGACSPSTPTPTRPASSTCSTTAPRGPPRRASTRTGSSPRGSATGSWSGRPRGSDPARRGHPVWVAGARFGP